MSEAYVGEIRMFGGNFAPQGWALCNGQVLPIVNGAGDVEPLYGLIGTTYGGDGQTNFALPDLRGRIPVHVGTNPTTNTSYSLAQAGGVETVTLISQQMPAHNHLARSQSGTGDQANPSGNFWGSSSLKEYTATAPNASMNAALISAAGGNQPHDNMMPFLAINFIICLEGIYPTQN